MNLTETQTQVISVSELHPNEGQMEAIGVHANPRQISEDDYAKLLYSMKVKNMTGILPLKVFCYNGEWVVLGGNMRLRAMQELGIEKVSCIVVPADTDAETLNEIIIKDNSTFGEWDMDALANWGEPLADWGVELPEEPNPDEFGTDFELPDGEKAGFQQMTFVLADEQAERIKQALAITKESAEAEMFGNKNSNGNALYQLVLEWETARK